jgi:hypothetical protein
MWYVYFALRYCLFILAQKRIIEGQSGETANETFLGNEEYKSEKNDDEKYINEHKPETPTPSHDKRDNRKVKEHWHRENKPNISEFSNHGSTKELLYLGEYYPPSVDEAGAYLPIPGLSVF